MASVDNDGNRWRTVILVVAPAVLLAAFVTHSYLPGRLPNDAAVAEATWTVRPAGDGYTSPPAWHPA
jgi:hypothetical protein